MNTGDDDWEKDKEDVISKIKRLGGRVFDDWNGIVNMDGTLSSNNKRWSLRSQSIKLCVPTGIKRVFLLSNEATQKPRYLLALALGIPCVSTQWLHNCEDVSSLSLLFFFAIDILHRMFSLKATGARTSCRRATRRYSAIASRSRSTGTGAARPSTSHRS